ncbi:hypothetical protein RYX36_024658 [Vicia faba]
MQVQHLTYYRHHNFCNKFNQQGVVKTPSVKLVYHSVKKRAREPKCPATGKRIQGIPHLRPTEYKRSRLSRNSKTKTAPPKPASPVPVISPIHQL